MAKERQGERSEKLKVFEQRLFLKSAVAKTSGAADGGKRKKFKG